MDDKKLKKTLSGVCEIMKGFAFNDKLKIYLLESLKVRIYKINIKKYKKVYMKVDDIIIKAN
jgi:hypothetical protein